VHGEDVIMPWFPDFASAVELARKQTRAQGQADPIGQFFTALNNGDAHLLETAWPGHVVVYDPRAGEISGHRHLRHFVQANQAWMAESHDDQSVVFRTYCSQWPVDGRRHLRPPVLPAGPGRPGDVVGRYWRALEAGDADAIVADFHPDGYYREPIGPHATHRGPAELRSYFTRCFSAGGGISLQGCLVTDDGTRCAVEYNCVRWGDHDLPPQAGLGVWERGPDGRLAAVRVYDDVEPPTA
jgi:hypothetical protein